MGSGEILCSLLSNVDLVRTLARYNLIVIIAKGSPEVLIHQRILVLVCEAGSAAAAVGGST